MKTLLRPPVVTFFLCAFVAAAEGRTERLGNDIKVIVPAGVKREASLSDLARKARALQTGANSQAEVKFSNGAVLRLAARTTFALSSGQETFDLRTGAVLARVPRGAAMRVQTASATTDLAGTTSLLEHFPENYVKLIVLEGTARIFTRRVGESVLISPGQLLMFKTRSAAGRLPNPVDIDIKRLMATSQLIKGHPPIGSESSIAERARAQKKQKSEGALADTNLVIFGRGTLVSLLPPGGDDNAPPPAPTPARKQTPR